MILEILVVTKDGRSVGLPHNLLAKDYLILNDKTVFTKDDMPKARKLGLKVEFYMNIGGIPVRLGDA